MVIKKDKKNSITGLPFWVQREDFGLNSTASITYLLMCPVPALHIFPPLWAKKSMHSGIEMLPPEIMPKTPLSCTVRLISILAL